MSIRAQKRTRAAALTAARRRSRSSSEQAPFEARDLYRIPLWLLQTPVYALAPVSLHLRVAALKGRLEASRSPQRRAIMEALERHLGQTVGEPELRRVVERYFEFRRTNEWARLWPQTRRFAGSAEIRLEGLEHLDRALARERGAILVSTHFGYARLIKPILRSRGRRPLLVGWKRRTGAPDLPPHFTPLGSLVHTRLLRLPRASRFDERWMSTVGEDLWAGLDVRPHAAALARNETLIILADGRVARQLRPAPVLGIQIPFAPGALRLAGRTGAAVLPTFVVDDPARRGPGAFRLVIHPPLDLQVTPDRPADLDANLRRFAAVYEEQVRANPHNFHWAWVHDGVFSGPH